MAVKTIETKAIISAQDQTGATFAQVAQKLKAMEGAAQRANSRVNSVNSNIKSVGVAASAAVGAAAGMLAERGIEKASELVRRSAETFKQYDLLVRNQRAIAGISEAQQKPLIDQAIRLGGSTPFNDIQVLEAQRDLIKRGIKVDLVEPIIKFASGFGQAMDVDLPTAAKTLETAIFSTGQNMETAAEAMKNAQRTTDIMVKTAKISGMSADEEAIFYKAGGAAAHAAGMSIETMSALGAMMRRGGIPGEEAGYAVRSIAGSLVSPKAEAMIALNAMGIDFSKHADMSKLMNSGNLEIATKRELGIRFNDKQKKNIQDIMQNPDKRDNQADFVKAIVDEFPDMSKLEAKQMAQIVKKFWKSSIKAVDVEGLLREIIAHQPTASQANSIFTKQQGGRFEVVAQRGLPEFENFRSQIDHVQPGFGDFIGTQNMAGFAGAVARFDGSTKNLETAIGRANESWVTPLINTAAEIKQGFVESGDKSLALATQLGIATAAIGVLSTAVTLNTIKNNLAGTPGGAMVGRLGAGAQFAAGMLPIGMAAYDVWNATKDADELPPQNGVERMGDKIDQLAGWGRWTPAKQLKRAGIGGVSPGLASFGFGPGGSPTPVKLEGSAGIDLKIEVSADSDSVVRKVAQFIRASGNLRDDTGTTMAPTQ
jgi:hypothetical protein